jgi:saccharopine dehydrogenase-like NADP-dependent oxidoreductase
MKKLMIYGATGYTGRMAAEHAKAQGLDVVIAGRNGEKLESLAAQLGVPYRVFIADVQSAESLEGIGVLLNFAGPFAQTADALMQACIEAKVDYLDITAEINVYRLALRQPRRVSCSCPASVGTWCRQTAWRCMLLAVCGIRSRSALRYKSLAPCHGDRP